MEERKNVRDCLYVEGKRVHASYLPTLILSLSKNFIALQTSGTDARGAGVGVQRATARQGTLSPQVTNGFHAVRLVLPICSHLQ